MGKSKQRKAAVKLGLEQRLNRRMAPRGWYDVFCNGVVIPTGDYFFNDGPTPWTHQAVVMVADRNSGIAAMRAVLYQHDRNLGIVCSR